MKQQKSQRRDSLFKFLIMLLITVTAYIILGFSLQSTKNIYEIEGQIESLDVKDSGYVTNFWLVGNKLKFELRVLDKKGPVYMPLIESGQKVRISYLKPCWGKAAVVEFTSENLTIKKEEQIKLYQEDRIVHGAIILAFLAVTLFLLISFLRSLKKPLSVKRATGNGIRTILGNTS
jgi:hypothetical protein